jgi:Ribonucleotide reductase inhibitor
MLLCSRVCAKLPRLMRTIERVRATASQPLKLRPPPCFPPTSTDLPPSPHPSTDTMPSAMQPRKRQFQPTIDSFFARADRDEWLANAFNDSRPLSTPDLPASVQASLLNVGMRVRKAVPEGYKTHKTALFTDPTPALPKSSVAFAPRRLGELQPFCGLHKIGGLSVQPHSESAPVDAFAQTGRAFADSDTALFTSQESNASTISTDSAPAANPNKRPFAEDEEEEESGFPLQFPDPVFDLSMSPSSRPGFPISHTPMPDLNALLSPRQFAKPKSKRKGTAARDENTHPATVDIDFEEAEFLTPWDVDPMDFGET